MSQKRDAAQRETFRKMVTLGRRVLKGENHSFERQLHDIAHDCAAEFGLRPEEIATAFAEEFGQFIGQMVAQFKNDTQADGMEAMRNWFVGGMKEGIAWFETGALPNSDLQ